MKRENAKSVQILKTLKDEILSEHYSKARNFPSETALSRRFKVSRSMMTSVVGELEREGLVSRCQGRGTFVTKRGASRKIGLLVPERACSEYYSLIVTEISKLAQKEGYALLFAEINTSNLEERAERAERVAHNFIEHGVAGIIFQPIAHIGKCGEVSQRILAAFDRAKIPVVFCDCDYLTAAAERSKFDVIGVNNVGAGVTLFNHLYSAGARKIHYLTIPYSARSHQDRLRGAMLASLEKVGIKWSGKNILIADPCDEAVVRRHLRRERPDAFICGNDITAVLLTQTLNKLGLKVPEDVMVTGFNDVSVSRLTTPAITTMRQPSDAIGYAAFYRLLARIGNPSLPPTEIYLPSSLIVRSSTTKIGENRIKNATKTRK